MSVEDKYEQMYHRIMEYEDEIHKANQRRIKAGIKCLIFVPLIFLFLLFVTDSDKVIFLVLWIVSLFIIAIYLIYVEYSDFLLQEEIGKLANQEREIEGLIGSETESLQNNIVDTLKQLEEKKDMKIEQAKERVSKRLAVEKQGIAGLLGNESASDEEKDKEQNKDKERNKEREQEEQDEKHS